MPKSRPLAERFWEKVDKRGPDDCWEWTGSKVHGYGRINSGGHYGDILLAHRVSWEIHYGPIPEGMCVLHRYDNPGCVNPTHLWLGTKADNIHDMIQKGRENHTNNLCGEAHGRAKVTEENVRNIRTSSLTLRELSLIYGIGQTQLSRIRSGKSWRWLDPDYKPVETKRDRLTEDEIRAIRASKEKGVVLAKRYHTSSATVSEIRNRKRWRWLE